MTLNAFHQTTAEGGIVLTSGVARTKEIVNLTKDIKTP
tara:strand:+ start:4354 stop:4467 length:114 start_codon:yes stop_codon:yes gene_type:complete